MVQASKPIGERVEAVERDMQNLANTVHKLADTTAIVERYITREEAKAEEREKLDRKRDKRNVVIYTAILGLLSTLLIRGIVGCENNYKLSLHEGTVSSTTDAGLPSTYAPK